MNIPKIISVSLATFLATCVFMLSVHVKDLVVYTTASTTNQAQDTYHELVAKATSEIHDHIDKQIVKTFGNNDSGNLIVSARAKEELDMSADEKDPGLVGHLHEILLMWHIYASLPFATR